MIGVMSAFDFTDISEEEKPEVSGDGFDFFQLQLPGLPTSSSSFLKKEGASTAKETTVASDSGDTSLMSRGGYSEIQGQRKGKALTGTDLQKMRSRREAQIIAKRKEQRSSRFAMQRRIGMSNISDGGEAGEATETTADATEESGMDTASNELNDRRHGRLETDKVGSSPYANVHEKVLLEKLAQNCDLVSGNNLGEQFEGVKWFRKILAGERSTNPPSNRVMECGIMPRIISFLSVGYNLDVQKEACLTISHLACADGDDIGAYLVSNGVIPLLVNLLASASGNAKERLRETCLSCIGNLSAYTSECRDLLLQSGVLVPLLTQLGMALQIAEGASIENGRVTVVKPNMSPSLATMTFLSWSFDNLAKGEPAPPDHVTRQTMLPLNCLLHSPDEKVVLTTLNTMLTLCESSRREVNVQMMLEQGMFKRVYDILVSQNGGGGGTPTSPGGASRRGKATMYGSKDLSVLTAINTKELCLRVFAAALRCSNRRLHQLAVVCPARFPHLLEMMVNELSRTAEIKPTLGVWGSMRAKGNSFYQGGASDIYKISPSDDEEGTNASIMTEAEVRRLEAEYDIKLELVSGISAIMSLDSPEDRKYTYRLLDLGVMYALHRAASYNYFNLNVVICHCVSLLLERLDYSQVALRPSQVRWKAYGPQSPDAPAQDMAQGGQISAADIVIPVVRQSVLLMTMLLPTMRGDLEVLMLILHRTAHLLHWAQNLGLLLLERGEASDIAEKMQDLPVHAHQDVTAWANAVHTLLEAIFTASPGDLMD